MITYALGDTEFVVKGFGGGKYLTNNMIARYGSANDIRRVSVEAEKVLISEGFIFSEVHGRVKFNTSKLPYISEHTVPAVVIRGLLMSSDLSDESIKSILQSHSVVTLVTREEDKMLNDNGLRSKMPSGWTMGDDIFARYRHVGITLSDTTFKVKGAAYR